MTEINQHEMNMTALGAALVAMRHRKGLTQAAVAGNTGIAQADISRIENGYANPSIRTLGRIADAMGTVLDIRFVEADGEEPA